MLEEEVRQLREAHAQARAEADPFERFNRAQGIGAIRDPYAGIAAMRAVAPLHRITLGSAPRPPGMPDAAMPRELYAVLSFDAVDEVLRDARRFCSEGYKLSMGPVMGHTILEMDGEEHQRHRALLSRAFTRRAVAHWERDLVRPIVHAYIDVFARRGEADLVRELTFPFPVRVVAAMIGLPIEEHRRFHRLAVELISVGVDWETGKRASRELRELYAPVVAARRRAPQDDLISVLAHAELDGTRLSDEEIYAFLCLLAPAGAETTYRSTSNLLFGLLSHPEQLDAVKRDRSLIPQATEDTTVAGVAIAKGTPLALNLGGANRDPARWTDPDRFDVFRAPKPHLAFAIGAHVCMGMHLARMETRVLLDALFDRLPNLRLDPDADDVHISGLLFRSPHSLPVRFDPMRRA